MKREEKAELRRKVVVVGAGGVGATYCYALAQSGLANEIILYDVNEDLMQGQVLDLVHGQPFFPTVVLRTGSPKDYSDAQLVVIAAGSAQKPGETRLQLLKKNAEITGKVAEQVAASGCTGVILVVSNPVDVLTHIAIKRSGWDRSRVIGSGTVLDSSRFRYLLSQHCNVDVHNVHAYILGEHGDSEFAAWSMTHVAGMKIEDFCPFCQGCDNWENKQEQIERQVRESAYHIINYKGSTQYAVGLALVRITGAILRNQHSVLTVSTMLNGEYGLNDVCLSVPCVVSDKGIARLIEHPLSENERALLMKSAGVLMDSINSLEKEKNEV